MTDRPTTTTSDGDITARRWLFFDVDTDIPTNTTASAAEVASTRDAAESVVVWLGDAGWDIPIIGASGNGSCLLYRVDLPNDAETVDLLKRFYGGLANNRNGMVGCHVDQSVFNAARLVRLPGTTNRKGEPLPDRPHRICKWEYPPE
jgi:hypothetical protein